MDQNKNPDIIAKAVQWMVLVGIPIAIGFAIKINVEVAVLKTDAAVRSRDIENVSREMKELNENVQSIKEKVIILESKKSEK